MKTAIQELIEHFTFFAGNYSSRKEILAKITQLLETEKQQIIDAREDGLYTQSNGTISDLNKSSEDYYNETFITP